MTAPPASIAGFTVSRELGRGGMGVVYLARDEKLDRYVAIKALPADLAADPDRLSRFQREAKVLASLSHPNIAAIYGLEDVNNQRYIVMEYIEGHTLAARLTQGPLPLDEALPLARQIAEAVEAAHEKGVIHRDLKPGNVMVTPAGKAKVLDFGLARTTESATTIAPPLSPFQPTTPMTHSPTMPGAIMGTAGYLSPEQARGRPVDKRTDIFSFGCVLYEMLTGAQPFPGETAVDAVGAILHREPDWSLLPPHTPAPVRSLLRRCLAKDKSKRLHDIADARIELDSLADEPAPLPLPSPHAPRRIALVAVAALTAGLALGLAAWQLWPRAASLPASTSAAAPRHLAVVFPPDKPLSTATFHCPFALSPDGSLLAYVGMLDGRTRLFFQHLDSGQTTDVPGTDGAEAPCFSPNGEWLAFHAYGRIWKTSVRGGAPVAICNTTGLRGITWVNDDTLVFTPSPVDGLFRVSAAGGTPAPLTTVDRAAGEFSHRFPHPLPDGDSIFFSTLLATKNLAYENTTLKVVSLKTGVERVVGKGSVDARYTPSGHLIYVRSGSLFAVPYDLTRHKITGAEVPLLSDVAIQLNTGATCLDLSADGTLVTLSGGSFGNDLVLVRVTRNGEPKEIAPLARAFRHPRVSPSGSMIAVTESGGDRTLWLINTADGAARAFPVGGAGVGSAWSPDEQYLYFSSDQSGNFNPYRRKVDGSGPVEHLLQSGNVQMPIDVSPDGRFLLLGDRTRETGLDVLLAPLDQPPPLKPAPLLASPANESTARFSPDGRWLVYCSDETGRFEVFVSTFPAGQGKWQISSDGGTEPCFSPTGKEIFFRSRDQMMSAPVTLTPSFSAQTPRPLFAGWYDGLMSTNEYAQYDVFPSGDEFVMIRSKQGAGSVTQATLVTNWAQSLPRAH